MFIGFKSPIRHDNLNYTNNSYNFIKDGGNNNHNINDEVNKLINHNDNNTIMTIVVEVIVAII